MRIIKATDKTYPYPIKIINGWGETLNLTEKNIEELIAFLTKYIEEKKER